MSADGTARDAPADYLTPAARAALDMGSEERIEIIRTGSWIPHSRAAQVRQRLQYVLTQPKSHRMIGLTLAGPTNNGKSTIVRSFVEDARTQPRRVRSETLEFLFVQTPAVPNPSVLFTQILRGAGDPKADKGTTAQKFDRVLHVLSQLHLRMLILDEIHHVMAASSRQTEILLNCLKSLSNQLQLPIVLIGTEDATAVLKTDSQVQSRYPPMMLPAWPDDEHFVALVKIILSTFPLRQRSALSRAAVRHLHKLSKGAIGSLVEKLQFAAVTAIENKAERIDSALIEAQEI